MKERYVYLVKCTNPNHLMFGMVKIGKSSDIDKRIYQYRRAYGDVELVGMIPGYSDLEKELLRQFKEFRLNSQGMLAHGRDHMTEWCRPAPKILEYFREHARVEVCVRISPDILATIESFAEKTGMDANELVNSALGEYLRQNKSPTPRIYDEFELTIAAPARGLSAEENAA